MEYIYEIFKNNDSTLHFVGTNFLEAMSEFNWLKGSSAEPEEFEIRVSKADTPGYLLKVKNEEDADGWQTTLERTAAWKEKTKKAIPIDSTTEEPFDFFKDIDGFHAKEGTKPISGPYKADQNTLKEFEKQIDPDHYKNFISIGDYIQLQWLEAKCRETRYINNPDKFEGFLEITIDKYLSRRGQKDYEIQELGKAIWYIKFLKAWLLNNKKPILISDIERLLNGKMGVRH